MNDRPLSFSDEHGILTPNSILKKTTCKVLTLKQDILSSMKMGQDNMIQEFWRRWSQEASRAKMLQSKWYNYPQTELQVGDIVLIDASNRLAEGYRLGHIESVKMSCDGRIRSASATYTIPGIKKNDPNHYDGQRKIITVERSTQ